MFRSCLSCSFYLFASFFLSSPLSFTVYFSPSFYRPLSVPPHCFLFALPLSFCWYYSCFILSSGSTFNFLHQERRCSICGPCRSLCAVQRCIASPGWVLVLISGIAEHHWHMRCALQVCWLQQGCVRVCLFVSRYVITARKERCGVLWSEV